MKVNSIYCGDNAELIKELKDDSVDITITSPPYNMKLRLQGNKYVKRAKNETGIYKKYSKFSDDLDIETYFETQRNIISECMRVSNLVFYIIQPVTGNKTALFKLIGHFAENIKEIFIWDKSFGEPAMKDGVVNSCYEMVIVFSKENGLQRRFKDCEFQRGSFDNILRYKKSRSKQIGHNATFPKDLIKHLITSFSRPGAVILDPYMGTGTTALVALENDRRYIGFELIQDYVEISEKRIMDFKSQKKVGDLYE